ncbi:MAG: hypothetical protein KJO36_01220 [Acidimicrobiia bacterium]|nr:hypothetical protein [Acidimicrobiia bacterium]
MRRSILFFCLMAAVVASGCKIRNDTIVRISDDRTGTLVFEVSADQELRDLLSDFGSGAGGGNILDGLDAQLENVPDGWTAEAFTDGSFEGVRTATTFSSIAELNALVDQLNTQAQEVGNLGSVISFVASDVDETIILEGEVGDLFGEIANQAGALGAGVDVSQLSAALDLRLVADLPGELTDESDGEIDVGTGLVIWEYRPSDTDFRIASTTASNSGLLIGLIVLGLVVVGTIGFVMIRARSGRAPTPVGESMLDPTEDPYAR